MTRKDLKNFWTLFSRNRGGTIGLFLLICLLLVAIFGPIVLRNDPWQMVSIPLSPPLTNGLLLGSDSLGRDVTAGIVYGARASLIIGLVSTMIAIFVGASLGAIAGYFGGFADDIVMRITEFFQTIPSFVLAILLVSIFRPSFATIVITIAVVTWPPVARLVRGEFMALKSREFVEAARAMGQGSCSIIFKEILPSALPSIVVISSLMVATAILFESALSFLGLGDPNLMTWGYMIGGGRSLIRIAWWVSVYPGMAIVLMVLALNLVGEGITDALNPRLMRKVRS